MKKEKYDYYKKTNPLEFLKKNGTKIFMLKFNCYLKRKFFEFIMFFLVFYKRKKYFFFEGKKYKYFFGFYNTTWMNERSIEIPLATNMTTKHQNKNILEIGNVLSHYKKNTWDILDKFEKSKKIKIINKDILEFNPPKKYKLIISISTIEHIGFDDSKKDSKKILKSLKHLNTLLDTNGEIVVTFPYRYNPSLDKIVDKNLFFDKTYFFKRNSKYNCWSQIKKEQIKKERYNYPFNNANILCLSIKNKK